MSMSPCRSARVSSAAEAAAGLVLRAFASRAPAAALGASHWDRVAGDAPPPRSSRARGMHLAHDLLLAMTFAVFLVATLALQWATAR